MDGESIRLAAHSRGETKCGRCPHPHRSTVHQFRPPQLCLKGAFHRSFTLMLFEKRKHQIRRQKAAACLFLIALVCARFHTEAFWKKRWFNLCFLQIVPIRCSSCTLTTCLVQCSISLSVRCQLRHRRKSKLLVPLHLDCVNYLKAFLNLLILKCTLTGRLYFPNCAPSELWVVIFSFSQLYDMCCEMSSRWLRTTNSAKYISALLVLR